MRRVTTSAVLAALCVAALAGAALAGTTHWSGLRSVAVTVQNGSLPPPYGRAHTKRFQTAAQLRQVTRALNSNKIAQRTAIANNGCTGGFTITIAISPRHGKKVRLTGYRCGGHMFGAIAGNVPAFLHAVGVSAP